MKFVRVREEEIEEKERNKKRNVVLFVDSFVGSGIELAEAIDDMNDYNNNNDFCRSLNQAIKNNGNYKLYVTAFMRYGKVYLKRVDL